jgi:hypothetical protein
MNDVLSDLWRAVLDNLGIAIPVFIVLIAALVVYLVLLVRAILDMLRHDAHVVLITFAFVALVPLPVFVIMGIAVLFIWHFHKREIVTQAG